MAAAREAGALLRRELHRPDGPRGGGSHADADHEAELLIRDRLLAALPSRYLGEETGRAGDSASPFLWLVDPNDGTSAFLKGYRGSAVSIALLHERMPVLGVVFAFAYPDDDGDVLAWAESCGPLMRNGIPVTCSLPEVERDPTAVVFVSQGADRKAVENARLTTPRRFVAVPSIAYRLALTAAGEGVACVSLAGPGAWDYAAGHALLRAAGGVLLDEKGCSVEYAADGASQTQSCFGGAANVAAHLARQRWDTVLSPPSPLSPSATPFTLQRPVRGRLIADAGLLSRAQGCLLGQLVGDALGSLVEFRSAADIAQQYPHGVRHLADGGTWDTLAGQPTDDSELALMLARSLVQQGRYHPAAVFDAYVHWYRSPPFDIGGTTRAALGSRTLNHASQANGSLMRISPLGLFAAGRPEHGAALARTDSGLTHPNPVCRDACAVFVAALAQAIDSGEGPEACYAGALAEAQRSVVQATVQQALEQARGFPPADYESNQGWVLIALQNAFFQLLHADRFEDGVVATVMAGGDTDTNAAIAGALLGAVKGREAIPAAWRRAVLSCRPLKEAGARRPRPREFWPVDALLLAEALLCAGQQGK
jgi:ADP-ribosylglycohydrolase/fructose-1,6-bisphosphatase/inositol monophosphatase family enzyme